MTSAEINSQEREGPGPMHPVFSWLGGPSWNIYPPVALQIQNRRQTWLYHFPERELISCLRPLWWVPLPTHLSTRTVFSHFFLLVNYHGSFQDQLQIHFLISPPRKTYQMSLLGNSTWLFRNPGLHVFSPAVQDLLESKIQLVLPHLCWRALSQTLSPRRHSWYSHGQRHLRYSYQDEKKKKLKDNRMKSKIFPLGWFQVKDLTLPG